MTTYAVLSESSPVNVVDCPANEPVPIVVGRVTWTSFVPWL